MFSLYKNLGAFDKHTLFAYVIFSVHIKEVMITHCWINKRMPTLVLIITMFKYSGTNLANIQMKLERSMVTPIAMAILKSSQLYIVH